MVVEIAEWCLDVEGVDPSKTNQPRVTYDMIVRGLEIFCEYSVVGFVFRR